MSAAQPAWSEQFTRDRLESLPPERSALLRSDREWAWAGVTGKGVRVGIIDSGIDNTHPKVDGKVRGFASFSQKKDGSVVADPEPHHDRFGHGTACAGIIRSFAPDAELVSIQVLNTLLSGQGATFLAGLEWAIDQGLDIVNLSLGCTNAEMAPAFYQLLDLAYFKNVLVVTAANNMPKPSYPSLFSAVASVACHPGTDPYEFYVNPTPPPEFGARGINIEVPWLFHHHLTVTGNSFAAPHITGLAARILEKHPGMKVYELKSVLRATASNAAHFEDAREPGVESGSGSPAGSPATRQAGPGSG